MRQALQKYGLFYLVIFLFIIFILLFTYNLENKNKDLTFAMLDVGQGDAIFIESPSGFQILIDSGRDKKVLSELSRQMSFFDRSIDLVIMTNPDLDHIGGFVEVLEKYKVDKILEPGTYNDSEVYKKIEEIIKGKNIPRYLARAGTRIPLGDGASLDILFPDKDVSTWDNNDGSIVARIIYGNHSFILTGDASIKTEKYLLDKFNQEVFDADFLKLGHHGSRTSTSLEFVQAITPRYALISSGQGNKYGHPHDEILDRLNSLNIEILRTDERGTIVFTCDKIELCKLK
ncbi:MAG: MBL fold metallo-hydrolase [Candidatus Pacebacteria bacterium]|nr:MBL fold metallo-hydrolase [Candidatus Paceibacterota bacterium]